jgi:signal transduction histidine kinase
MRSAAARAAKLPALRLGRNELLLTCALAVAIGVVFAVDRVMPVEVPMVVLYGLPLFAAGVWLPRWTAVILGALTLVLYVAVGYEGVNGWSPFRVVGLVILALAGAWALQTGNAQSRLRRVSEELADKAAQLEAAQAEREMMASVVAHELRGALSTVSGYSKLLLRPKHSADIQPALQAIARGSDQLDRLTQDLLDAANLNVGRFNLTRQTCDLGQIVGENVELYRSLGDHPIEVSVPSEPVFGNWDELRVNQIVRNLLSNSLKYSPPGESVQVDLESRPGEAWVGISNAAGQLSPQDLDLLFLPYSRLRPNEAVRGTGLGLFVSKVIAERHGGGIGAEIQDGRVCFHFSLPLPEPATLGRARGRPRGIDGHPAEARV